MRRTWIAVGLTVLLLLAAGWGWNSWRESRLREDLAKVDRDLQANLFGRAGEKLRALNQSHPERPEVLYRLGLAEQAAGRIDAALASWSRIPADSVDGVRSATRRATVLTNAGRYTEAEAAILPALDSVGHGSDDLRELQRAWTRLLRFQGRTWDVRRVLCDLIATTGKPSEMPPLLKELWLLDTTGIPVDGLATVLARADAKDPRVWLGQANLALVSGRLDAAADWLGRCESAQPDDPAVARSRLELARSRDDVPAAVEALRKIPADGFTPLERAELRAWLGGRLRDSAQERAALEHVLTLEAGNPGALERLASLESAAGQTTGADAIRLRKAEADRARDRYRKVLLDEGDLTPRAGELATLSRAMGRTFDAEAWAFVGARGTADAGKAQSRLAAIVKLAPAAAGSTAHDLVADLLKDGTPARAASPASLPRIAFEEQAAKAGLDFRFDNGATARRQLPETMSGGVAVLDYDGDGRLDVYVVQGGVFPPVAPGESKVPGDRLFRNKGDGTFEDATAKAGLPATATGYGHGVTVGDYDNDGKPDLFVTRYNAYTLLHNLGGRFEDVTQSAGLAGPRGWPTSAALADLDGDGDLDLYVCHYMAWDAESPVACQDDKGQYLYCDPSRAPAEPDHLFRNDGGKFVDISQAAGITGADRDGRGLGVLATDLDGDGKLDIFVANDGTANFLFLARGDTPLTFSEEAHAMGVAANAEGGYHAGMGVACGDLDGDGVLDLLVTNFFGESTTFYQGMGKGLFTDRTAAAGFGVATRTRLGFGIGVLDADLDGRPDVAIANGHVNDNRPYFPFAMPPQLLWNRGDGRFLDVGETSGPAWSKPGVARGLAVADLDNDGRSDLLIVNQNEPLAYLRNATDGGRSLTLTLSATRGHRDAVGATVRVQAAGRTQTWACVAGGSYQSSGDRRIVVGLGATSKADAVEVTWPSGRSESWKDLASGGSYILTEGSPEVGRAGPGR